MAALLRSTLTIAEIEKKIKESVEELRYGNAVKATESLIDLEIPLDIIKKFELERRIAKYSPKNMAGFLIRKFHLVEEETKLKLEQQDMDEFKDAYDDEIAQLTMFTTQEQYLKAKEELEQCNFKNLLEEYQDAPEFCEPLLMVANYRDGRQTPSPKKEVFKKATAAQRKDLRKIHYRGPPHDC
ncbi:unnamed protein product [Caenorhabditis brenneri]